MRTRHLLLSCVRRENFNEFKMLLIACLQSNGKQITTRTCSWDLEPKGAGGRNSQTDINCTDPMTR